MRLYYSELDAVCPAAGQRPAINLPGTVRSDLQINWLYRDVIYQLVLDRSGSMGLENKMSNVKAAAKLLVDLAEIGHATVGVVSFDDQIEVLQPLTPIDSNATKVAIKAKIDTLFARNNTAIGDAATAALNGLNAYGGTNRNRLVYLLTNGQSNTGSDPLSVLPAYTAAGVRMFTFAYGSDANFPLLQQMARDTGGRAYTSPTTLPELTQIFLDAYQLASPSIGVSAGSSTLAPQAPAAFPIRVDATLRRLDLTVNYPGAAGSTALSLLSPAGVAADPPVCNDSGVATICLFRVTSPAPGIWTLRATSNSTVAISYRAEGISDGFTPAAAIASLTGDSITYPTPMVLLATLRNELPIAGAIVTGTIQKPDGTAVPVQLRDDGVAPDATANDGLYSAIFNYSANGLYNIAAQFNNNSATARMTSISQAPAIGENNIAAPLSPPVLVNYNFERFARTQVVVTGVRTDDHGNVPRDATLLLPNNTDVAGKIDYVGDLDVFRINATQTGKLTVRVTDLAGGMDPHLRIYAANGSTVLADADLGGSSSVRGYLTAALGVTGGDTIYAEVANRAPVVGSTYNISAGTAIFGDPADLTIQATASPNPIQIGAKVTYRLTVTNVSATEATNVVVADNLPASVTFLTCTATGGGVCSGSGNSRTVIYASLAGGASASIVLEASVSCSVANGTAIANTATVSSTPVDADLNNSSTATTVLSNPQMAIANYQFVSQQPAAVGNAYFLYRADLVNPGGALGSVTATASTIDPFGIRPAPGQNTLTFSPVPANSQITSAGTFALLVNPGTPVDFCKLQWQFQTSPAPPVARPGSDRTATIANTVILDGSGSTNPSGIGTLVYNWVFTSRPAGSNARLNNATGPTAPFVPNVAGTYVVTLTVSNGTASNSASITVTVTR